MSEQIYLAIVVVGTILVGCLINLTLMWGA